MKPRILAIDDEAKWLDNFSAWIPTDQVEQDSAMTTSEAVEYLRRRRYDVVLLDLSMQLGNDTDRSNRGIQEYLAAKPEGTEYIVVSGTIDFKGKEVRDAAISLGAFDIVFKKGMDPHFLRDRVTSAIERSQRKEMELIQEARVKLTDASRLEHVLFKALNLGADGLYHVLDGLFRRLAPIVPHSDRPFFVGADQQVFALVWSRQLGKPVSISLASGKLPEQDARKGLATWLGWEQRGNQVFAKEIRKVSLMVFEEPNISDQHFELPKIHV